MNNTKGAIFDIDGVLKYHGKVYPNAIETIDTLRKNEITIRFMTNSTLKSKVSCAEELRKSGFTISSYDLRIKIKKILKLLKSKIVNPCS